MIVSWIKKKNKGRHIYKFGLVLGTRNTHSLLVGLMLWLFHLLQGGPYHDLLHSLLGAYACYRPDVGYVSMTCLLIPCLAVFEHFF